MKVLALVLARGGSKRLPQKNKLPLCGKPLIAWSIEAAQGVTEICDVLVSTDDSEIMEISRAYGALVPWLRPKELASDNSTSVDAAIHAVEWYENERGEVDGLLLLQPTSPFRTKNTIKRGISLYRDSDCHPVLGVSPSHSHPMWTFQIENGALKPFLEEKNTHKRAQDLPPAYVLNGAFYLIKPSQLKERKSFYSDNAIPLVIESQKESLDIDTKFDWVVASAVCDIEYEY